LIRGPLVNIQPATGILNLHTGLSPYVKGGPNCTNWCIANNQFDLIGNTIMWLNAGIDSGNIITTETVDILRAKDLDTAHLMVMEQAHDLYVRTLRYIESQTAPYHSVPQSEIGLGQLYLTKMWTAEKRKQLLKNWRNKKTFTSSETPRTIALST
jgi:methionyl-tRNA formyltransferase